MDQSASLLTLPISFSPKCPSKQILRRWISVAADDIKSLYAFCKKGQFTCVLTLAGIKLDRETTISTHYIDRPPVTLIYYLGNKPNPPLHQLYTKYILLVFKP